MDPVWNGLKPTPVLVTRGAGRCAHPTLWAAVCVAALALAHANRGCCEVILAAASDRPSVVVVRCGKCSVLYRTPTAATNANTLSHSPATPPHPPPHTHQAEVAFNLGLIDTRQRREAEAIQFEVVELVRDRQWVAARRRSDELLAYITTASASATLEDIRRDKAYDAEDRVSAYLNLPGGREERTGVGVRGS